MKALYHLDAVLIFKVVVRVKNKVYALIKFERSIMSLFIDCPK